MDGASREEGLWVKLSPRENAVWRVSALVLEPTLDSLLDLVESDTKVQEEECVGHTLHLPHGQNVS
jgi:hypothetical protein